MCVGELIEFSLTPRYAAKSPKEEFLYFNDFMAKLNESGNPHQHISKQYDHELFDIRSRVLTLGGLVEEQIGAAVKAMIDGDMELARRVIDDDGRINAMEVSIDEECTQILALRQPSARDLRLVMAVIKTIIDLERIGDEAKRIARLAIDLSSHVLAKKNQFPEIEQLAGQVRNMFRDTLDAFARMDVNAAFRVVKGDQSIDRQYEGIMRQQITYIMEDPKSTPVFLDLMWTARSLERIGDRSCNISEYVIYFVKGKNIRHISIDQAENDLRSG